MDIFGDANFIKVSLFTARSRSLIQNFRPQHRCACRKRDQLTCAGSLCYVHYVTTCNKHRPVHTAYAYAYVGTAWCGVSPIRFFGALCAKFVAKRYILWYYSKSIWRSEYEVACYEHDGTTFSPLHRPWTLQHTDGRTDGQIARQIDRRHHDANSNLYCVAVRSVKSENKTEIQLSINELTTAW